jgi:hypothetical protein
MVIPMGRRCVLITQKKYTDWHKEQSRALLGTPPLPNPCSLTIVIYLPDARKTDLTNKAESIMDLLVDNAILEDDNWNCVPILLLISGGIDRANPRAEITWQTLNNHQQ